MAITTWLGALFVTALGLVFRLKGIEALDYVDRDYWVTVLLILSISSAGPAMIVLGSWVTWRESDPIGSLGPDGLTVSLPFSRELLPWRSIKSARALPRSRIVEVQSSRVAYPIHLPVSLAWDEGFRDAVREFCDPAHPLAEWLRAHTS
ncbi:MAG: hypothetical protein AAF791_09305 [Bacteroidota bacterium]